MPTQATKNEEESLTGELHPTNGVEKVQTGQAFPVVMPHCEASLDPLYPIILRSASGRKKFVFLQIYTPAQSYM